MLELESAVWEMLLSERQKYRLQNCLNVRIGSDRAIENNQISFVKLLKIRTKTNHLITFQ